MKENLAPQANVHKPPIHQTWMTIVFDRNLNIVEIINPQYCMLLQLDEQDLLHSNVDELEHLTDEGNSASAAIIRASLHKAFDENRNVYFEYTTTHRDNTVTYAVCYAERGADELIYMNVIKIDEENIFEARQGFTNYIIDITINNVSVGVFMRHFGDDGTKKYILFNDVAKEFFESDDVMQSRYWHQDEDDAADTRAMQLRDPLKIETVIRDHEGNIKRWLVLTKKKISSRASGCYIVTTVIDITQRRQNEILLEQQFALLDSMYKHIPVGVIIYAKDGKLISLNQKSMDILGIDNTQSAIGINLFDDPNMPDQIMSKIRRGEDVEYEINYEFTDDVCQHLHSTLSGTKTLMMKASVIHDKEGKPSGYLHICEDITTKKLAEQEVEKKHKLLQAIHDTAATGIEVYDKNGRLIEMNRYEMRIMGITNKESVLGVNFFDNPNIAEEHKQGIREGRNFNTVVSYDFNVSQQQRYFNSQCSGIRFLDVKTSIIRDAEGNFDGFLLTNQDRTEEIIRERQLQDTRENLKLVLEAGGIDTWTYDTSTHIFQSLSDTRNIGFQGAVRAIHPDDIDELDRLFRSLISGETERATAIYRDKMSSPDYRYYRSMMVGKREGTKVVSILGTKKDVTDEYVTHKQLEEYNRRTELITRACGIVQWDYDIPSRTINNFSQSAMVRAQGLDIEEYLLFVHPDDRSKLRVLFESFDHETADVVSVSYKLRSQEGSYRDIMIDGVPMADDKGNITKYIGFSRDQSEWVEVNNRLARQNSTHKLVLDNINVGLLYINKECIVEWGNLNTKSFLLPKIPIQQCVTGSRCEYWGQEGFHCQNCLHRTSVQSGEIKTIDYTHQDNVVNFTSIPVRDADNNIAGTLLRIEDVSDKSRLIKNLEVSKHRSEYSLSLLHNIIEKLPMGLFVKDIDDNFKYVIANSKLALTPDDNAQALIGKNDYEVRPKERADRYRAENLRAIAGNGEPVISLSLDAFDDRGIWLEKTEAMFQTTDGRKMLVGVVNDVSEREKARIEYIKSAEGLKEANLVLTNILQHIPVGFFIKDVDDDNRYIMVNQRLADIHHCEVSDFLGHSINNVIDEKYVQDFIADNETSIMQNGAVHVAIRHLNVDGQPLTLEVTQKMFISVNGHRLIIAIIADISNKERYQRELEQAKERAEQSDKLKSSFLANMSHEIRTPLNAIVGFSTLLAESDELAEKQEYKNIIATNSDYLLRLINDILDLSKIEAGIIEWRYEPFNIVDVEDELYTVIKAKIVRPEVELLMETPYDFCEVTLDKNRIKQVWINFLTNAVKCTFKGHIKMGFEIVEHGIRIYVEDTGVGIPEQNREKVFARFEKLNEFAQGTGLGLSICKAIVDKANGEIGFDSTVGVGTRFWAFIPCSPTLHRGNEESPTIETQRKAVTPGDISILVVEDNDSNFLLVQHLLKAYNLTRATNGADAVERACNGKFNLILMDMRMPVMDGLEATKQIRGFNTEIPIVALTANAFDSDKEAALAAGCNAVIVKPLKKEELFAVLNNL